MRNNIIRFIEHKRTSVRLGDIFQFNPHRPMKWLQRLCCWTLGKLGCYVLEQTSAKVHSFNSDIFSERFIKQYYSVRDVFYHRPKTVFIGAEDFDELMSVKVGTLVGFRAQYMYDGRIMGMQVNIVPWMQGVLFI